MERVVRQFVKVTLLAAFFIMSAVVVSAQVSDAGTINLQGNVTAYVEIRAGGAAALAGNVGGGISNNKAAGDRLDSPTVLTIDFGEVGPTNTSSFVTATVPLRLRSNVSYTLSVSTPALAPADADAVQDDDLGFGITSVSRAGASVNTSGTDTILAANGDPTGNGAYNAAGRWVYNAGFSLNDYTTSSAVLSGDRIMKAAAPTGIPGTAGVIVNTLFSIKPQFYSAGSFSTTVTFTITNP